MRFKSILIISIPSLLFILVVNNFISKKGQAQIVGQLQPSPTFTIGPQVRRKSTCSVFFQEYVDWMKNPTNVIRTIPFYLVSNSNTQAQFFGGSVNVASYANGEINSYIPQIVFSNSTSSSGPYALFKGTGKQYFNNKVVFLGPDNGKLPSGPIQPFSVNQPESIDIEISTVGTYPKLTTTSSSKGTNSYKIECKNGVLIGIGETVQNNPPVVILSFVKYEVPIIK